MHPELFRIPFTSLTVKSYGLMMVVGFLAAMWVIRRLSVERGDDPEHITTAALYSLISGVIGSRIMYVAHYWRQFADRPLAAFAVWEGGLELLGGVILAILVITLYLRVKKLPVRHYLDILAIGLMFALAFGRIGCFMNGCCFGKPTDSFLGVRFPYASLSYFKQINPDPQRNRSKPYIDLPFEYFGYYDEKGVFSPDLKPLDKLTNEQKYEVLHGKYRPLRIIPTQLISSVGALGIAGILYLYRRWGRRFEKRSVSKPAFLKPGTTFGLIIVVYSIGRFLIEFLRDDNPFEADGLTVSQNLCILLFFFGLVLMGVFAMWRPPSSLKTQAGIQF